MFEKLFIRQADVKAFFGCCLAGLTFLIGDVSEPLLAAVLVLIALDWATGLYKGWVLRCLTSRRMVEGAEKMVLYFILLIVGHQLSHCGFLLSWVDDMLFAFVGLTEGISNLENVYVIASARGMNIRWLNFLINRLYIVGKEMERKAGCDEAKK